MKILFDQGTPVPLTAVAQHGLVPMLMSAQFFAVVTLRLAVELLVADLQEG